MSFTDETLKKYDKMLEELLELDSGLNEWEIGFIDSLSLDLEKFRYLTPRQTGVLTRIWREKVEDVDS